MQLRQLSFLLQEKSSRQEGRRTILHSPLNIGSQWPPVLFAPSLRSFLAAPRCPPSECPIAAGLAVCPMAPGQATSVWMLTCAEQMCTKTSLLRHSSDRNRNRYVGARVKARTRCLLWFDARCLTAQEQKAFQRYWSFMVHVVITFLYHSHGSSIYTNIKYLLSTSQLAALGQVVGGFGQTLTWGEGKKYRLGGFPPGSLAGDNNSCVRISSTKQPAFVCFVMEASRDEENGGATAAGCFDRRKAFTSTPCPRESLLSDSVKVKSRIFTVRQSA